MMTTQTSPAANYVSKQSFVALLATSTVGLALLGIAAFQSFAVSDSLYSDIFHEPEDHSEEDMQAMASMVVFFGSIGAGFVAGIIGLVISPLISWLLRRTNRERSLMAIYALCLLPTIIWAYFEPWLMFGASAVVPATIGVLTLSAIHGERYRRLLPPNTCPHCMFNLTGLRDAGCPECGWQREPSSTP